MPTRAIEPPIWCALIAKENDRIIDMEVTDMNFSSSDDVVIVVMGSNPSASSTPKMPEALRIKQMIPHAKLTGLHPMATGEADIDLPTAEELVKIKRARWELLDMTKYKAHNWHCLKDIEHRDKYAVLYTSYGCPYDCDFCNIHTIYKGRKVCYRKPIDVAEEIDYLVRNYGIRNLKLCDELFTLNPKHVSDICNLIKGYKLNIWAYARVGSVTTKMLYEMKLAGINWLAYGFESGNADVLKGVSKKYGDIFETVKITKDAGINIMGNFIFGLPEDTMDTMEETFQLAQALECEYVNFYCAMAYPGSKLYDQQDHNWKHYDQYSPYIKPMNSKYLSQRQVVDFRTTAFQRYFTDKKYLNMVRSKFGMKAKHHIIDMVS